MAADLGWRRSEGLKLTEAADRAGLSPAEFVCEILRACGMAVGIFRFRAGERTEEDDRARYLRYHNRQLGDNTWAEPSPTWPRTPRGGSGSPTAA